MDSVKYKGKLGDAVKSVFTYRVPGLPQPEPAFTVRYIEPRLFKGLLKNHKNIVIVTTFDEKTGGSRELQKRFTKESIVKLEEDPSMYMAAKKDEYARGQTVMHLFGRDEATLIENISQNKEALRNYYQRVELERLKKGFRKMSGEKGLDEQITEKHGFDFDLLKGYRIAKDTAGLLWLRHPEAGFDKNLVFAYKPYQSETQFSLDSMVAWKRQLGQQHLKDPKSPDYFVDIQEIAPIDEKQTSLNGKYAKELRGLWRVNERFVGGPFVGYTVVDETRGRLYYIEGFVSAPEMKKRELIRELTAVLETFQPSQVVE